MKTAIAVLMLVVVLSAGCASRTSVIFENSGPAQMVFRIENDPPGRPPAVYPDILAEGNVWPHQSSRVWYPIRGHSYALVVFKGKEIGRFVLPDFKVDTYRLVVEYENDVPVGLTQKGPMTGPD